MDLLGGYGSSSSESEGPPAQAEEVTQPKKVFTFQVPVLKPLPNTEDYRPKKRQNTEEKPASLLDSLPKPKTELYDLKATETKNRKSIGNNDQCREGQRVSSSSAGVTAAEEDEAGPSRPSYVGVEAAPEVPSNPNDMYRVGAAGQQQQYDAQYDYNAYYGQYGYYGAQEAQHQGSQPPSTSAAGCDGAQRVLELALEEERNRSQKRGRKGGRGLGLEPQVVEVNQASLRGSRVTAVSSNPIRDAMGEGYEEKLRREATGKGVSQVARSKHQIGSLYQASKKQELEILANRAKSMKSKRETQGKYGW